MSTSFNEQFDQHGAWRREFGLRLKLLAEWMKDHELLDAGVSASPDLVQTAGARSAAVLCRWLDARSLPAGLGPPQVLAGTIVAALMGLKSSARSIDDLRTGEAQLARLVARALG